MKTVKLSLFMLGFSITSFGQSLHLQMKDHTDKYFPLSSIRNFTVKDNSMTIMYKNGYVVNHALSNIALFNYDLNTLTVKSLTETVTADVQVFPNPTSDEITISMTGNTEKSIAIQIYQATGELVFSKETQDINNEIFSEKISLRDLNSGVYFVRVHHQNTIITKKIIKN